MKYTELEELLLDKELSDYVIDWESPSPEDITNFIIGCAGGSIVGFSPQSITSSKEEK